MVVPLPEDEGPVTLGRAVDNHVRLPERNVSRRHAELHLESDGWMLVDVDSYNGLRVNGEQVERQCKIKRGDYIALADYQLMVGCESVPLEEDVAALASAAQKFKKPVEEEGLEGQEMLDLFAAGFSGAGASLGSPAGAPGPAPYEPLEPPPSSSSAKKLFWLLAGAAAISVAVATFWRVGGGKAADAGVARAQDALAAAGIRPAEPTKVESPKEAPSKTQGEAQKPSFTPSVAPESGTTAASTGGPAERSPDQDSRADNSQEALGAATSAGSATDSNTPSAEASNSDQGQTPTSNNDEESRRNARRQAKREAARSSEQAKAWIKRARKAAMAGRHQEALTWARRSFRAQASQEALQVLGLSACKLSRRRQAEFALNRLRKSESRRILRNVCGAAGISL